MRRFGRFDFPTRGTTEHLTWKAVVLYRAMGPRVLAVARTRIEGAWAAYVADVRGVSHQAELPDVLDHGTKLDERVARALFPVLDEVPYAE
jgi:hypothetical protein